MCVSGLSTVRPTCAWAVERSVFVINKGEKMNKFTKVVLTIGAADYLLRLTLGLILAAYVAILVFG